MHIRQSSNPDQRLSLALVAGQEEWEALVNTFVKQDPHRTQSNSSEAEFFRFFEDLDGEFTADSRKSFQKIVQRVAIFQVVKQRLHGHTRAPKNRGSVQHPGIADDRFVHSSIVA